MRGQIGKRSLMLLALVFLSFGILACATGPHLVSEYYKPGDFPGGTASVILYGAGYKDDPETFAIVALDAPGYEFIPYTAKFYFTVERGLTVSDAIGRAGCFVTGSKDKCNDILFRALKTEAGELVGYEITPRDTSEPVIFNTSYKIEGKKVIVYIYFSKIEDTLPLLMRPDY